MGEAPDLFEDHLHRFHLKSGGHEMTVDVGSNKTYVVGGMENYSPSTIGVRVLDNSTGEWMIPTVLGSKPGPSKGHSAVLIDDDRILVVKGDSSSDDCFWFLEVNTAFVREQKKRLGVETVAWSKGLIGEAEKPIVISGPSGVGKGTLITKLVEEFPSMFGFSVSHTTRAPRTKEQNGVHYHFTERSVMEKDIADGKFLEFASVHGNLYGTSVEAVDAVADQGKRCILDIDVQGARSVRASSLEAIFIFVRPPSFEELEKRLRARGTETEEQIQKRLRNARMEIDQANSPGLFDHILVNDDLETCYQNLKKLLGLDDEAGKTSRKSVPESFNMPLKHSISRIDHKIVINCGEQKKTYKKTHLISSRRGRVSCFCKYLHIFSVSCRFVLDLSSMRGGAPGRTRGLNVYSVEPSFTNGINGTKTYVQLRR